MAPRKNAAKPLGEVNPPGIASRASKRRSVTESSPPAPKTEAVFDDPIADIEKIGRCSGDRARLDENYQDQDSLSEHLNRSSSPTFSEISTLKTDPGLDSDATLSSRAVSPSTDSNLSFATIKKEDFDKNLDVEIDFKYEDSNSLPPFTPEPPKPEANGAPSDQEIALNTLEQEQRMREERFRKLQQLLAKSSVYSQYLAEEVAKQNMLFAEKTKQKEAKILEGGRKRKAAGRPKRGRGKKARPMGEQDDADAIQEMVESDGTLKLELFKGSLREYQVQGVQWMSQLWGASTSGILGDEMGLGKTVQIIAFICHMVAGDIRAKPFMIVVPLSTLTNWVCEFQHFAPSIPFLVYHGEESKRRASFRHVKVPVEVEGAGFSMRPVLLTTYETVIRDKSLLSTVEWASIIIDEGHRLKNHNSRLAIVMRTLRSGNRMLLTGTPLQNNLTELWSLLNFLMPELFSSLDVFSAWFDPTALAGSDAGEVFAKEEREMQLISKFHGIISPFLLRRVKADCGLKLPPKREILVKCNMTSTQLELHEAILDYTIGDLANTMQEKDEAIEYDAKGRPQRKSGAVKMDYSVFYSGKMSENGLTDYYNKIGDIISLRKGGGGTSSAPRNYDFDINMQSPMMQLRKCSAHPYLLAYPLDHCGQFLVDENIVNSCGKMRVLDRLLDRLLKDGHKVLIFSHFVIMLDVLTDYMHFKKIQACRLDGKMSLGDRAEQIKRFNEDPSASVFLLSTRAGGLGLNLMAADTVIIYDSDWNPQVDLQAQDRAHRIGQTKPVLVFRLVTSNTVEEVIMARAAAKRKIETVILGGGDFKAKNQPNKDEQKDMMQEVQGKLKALDRASVFNSDRDSLTEEQLDQMLDRSALEAPEKMTKTEELKWQHEYVGPVQRKKAKRASKVASDDGPSPKLNPGSSGVFEVLVECASDEAIEL